MSHRCVMIKMKRLSKVVDEYQEVDGMELYYYIRAWINYLDITFLDVVVATMLVSLIVLGMYVFSNKNSYFGLAQVMLTLSTPCLMCAFYMSNKLYWEMPQKMWMKLIFGNDIYDDRILGILVLIFVPALIVVTVKNLTMLKK